MSQKVSKKSWKTTVILFHLFGVLGVHRFYVRKWGTGILYLLASFFAALNGTVGSSIFGELVFGNGSVWVTFSVLSVIYLMDIIKIYSGNFTDNEGALVLPPYKVLLLETIRDIHITMDMQSDVPAPITPAEIRVPVPSIETPQRKPAPQNGGSVSLVRAPISAVQTIGAGEYIALDTETTGLSTENDKVIEIALLKIKDGELVDEYCTLVNPQQHINSRASKINGIYDDDVKDAPLYDEVGEKLAAFLGNCTIIGHNVKFDLGFMGGLLKNVTLAEDVTWNYIDTIDLAKIAYPGQTNYKLQTLVQSLGIETDGAHRARADAIAAWKLFELCKKEILKTDELYDEALKIVVETSEASTALLQRRLKIGYSRAARIIDQMEMRGIVGPFEGTKPRKILIDTPEKETVNV